MSAEGSLRCTQASMAMRRLLRLLLAVASLETVVGPYYRMHRPPPAPAPVVLHGMRGIIVRVLTEHSSSGSMDIARELQRSLGGEYRNLYFTTCIRKGRAHYLVEEGRNLGAWVSLNDRCNVLEPPDMCWRSGSAATFQHNIDGQRIAGVVGYVIREEPEIEPHVMLNYYDMLVHSMYPCITEREEPEDGSIDLTAVADCMSRHTTQRKRFLLLMCGAHAESDPLGRHLAYEFLYDVPDATLTIRIVMML